LAVLILSLIFFLGLAMLFEARLPTRPEPSQNKVVPVWMTGKDPRYANHTEERLWKVSEWTFFVSVLLFFVTVATAEYRKEKERREARRGSTRTI